MAALRAIFVLYLSPTFVFLLSYVTLMLQCSFFTSNTFLIYCIPLYYKMVLLRLRYCYRFTEPDIVLGR